MPSAWKSRSACRAIRIALGLLAAALMGSTVASAQPVSTVSPVAPVSRVSPGGAPPAPADSRAWTPLADLYAARSLPAGDLTQAGDSAGAPATAALARDVAAEPTSRAVNPRKALIFSLLLPGAGELYTGHKGRATGFLVSEGAIWAHFAAWEIAGHLRKNDYIEQAMLRAGVGVDSESDDYWRLVGAYLRSSGSGPDSYEETLRREARIEFPSDPAAQDAWVAARLPTGNRAWNWTSGDIQASYRETRQNAARAFNRAKFSFALAILNRLASAIDTQILHRSDTKSQRSALDPDEPRLLAIVTADGGGRVLIRHRF